MKTVVVLCVHRSGSTLLAGILHRLGVFMGKKDDLRKGKHANKHGCFENQKFLSLSHKILYDAGSRAIYYDFPREENIQKVVQQFEPEIARLLNRHKNKPIWGWKDPATYQIIPYIHDKLTNPHYIFLHRDIKQVMNSIIRVSRYRNVLPSMIHEMSLFEHWRRRIGIIRRMYGVLKEEGNLVYDKEFLEELLQQAYKKIEHFIEDKKHLKISFDDLVGKTTVSIEELASFLEIELTPKKKKRAMNFLHPELVNFKGK